MIAGYAAFVPGLAIVYFHNRWTNGWPVLVTVMGWLSLVVGLLRMVFPTQLAAMAKKIVPAAAGVFPVFAGRSQGRHPHGHPPRPAGAVNPRPLEHACSDHWQEGGLPVPERHIGGHHDRARAAYAGRTGRAGRVRARVDTRPHGRRQGTRQGAGRENGA